jgi:hypothetical protein
MCGTEELFALGAGSPVDRFYALDAERLDDSFGGHTVLILEMRRLGHKGNSVTVERRTTKSRRNF